MTSVDESFEERLSRLGAGTQGVRPRADFQMRVMSRIVAQHVAAPPEDWSMQVLRWARVGMTVATLAAAAFVVVAWHSANSADQEEALGYGVVEAFE
jgi:hypothetical protein